MPTTQGFGRRFQQTGDHHEVHLQFQPCVDQVSSGGLDIVCQQLQCEPWHQHVMLDHQEPYTTHRLRVRHQREVVVDPQVDVRGFQSCEVFLDGPCHLASHPSCHWCFAMLHEDDSSRHRIPCWNQQQRRVNWHVDQVFQPNRPISIRCCSICATQLGLRVTIHGDVPTMSDQHLEDGSIAVVDLGTLHAKLELVGFDFEPFEDLMRLVREPSTSSPWHSTTCWDCHACPRNLATSQNVQCDLCTSHSNSSNVQRRFQVQHESLRLPVRLAFSLTGHELESWCCPTNFASRTFLRERVAIVLCIFQRRPCFRWHLLALVVESCRGSCWASWDSRDDDEFHPWLIRVHSVDRSSEHQALSNGCWSPWVAVGWVTSHWCGNLLAMIVEIQSHSMLVTKVMEFPWLAMVSDHQSGKDWRCFFWLDCKRCVYGSVNRDGSRRRTANPNHWHDQLWRRSRDTPWSLASSHQFDVWLTPSRGQQVRVHLCVSRIATTNEGLDPSTTRKHWIVPLSAWKVWSSRPRLTQGCAIDFRAP